MKINSPAGLLRIFVSSTDRNNQDLLSESIVLAAKMKVFRVRLY